jgi:vitamin B12 transporter
LYSEYGNLKLKPEESNNYEVGAQVLSSNKKNSIRLVGFKRDIRQLIIFYTDPVTYDGKYLNKDKQNDYGVELETELVIGKKVQWVNNITYVNGEGTMDNQKVKNFYLRPNFTMNSILNFHPIEKLTVSPSIRFVGNRLKGEYDEGPEKLPNYYTLDFYAGYNISKKIRGFVDARNITDQFYMDIIGYNSRRANFSIGITFVN